jgi:predicted nucleic acid-binding protein
MIIYFDSSALVKSVVDEEGSPQVKRFLSECLVSEEIDFVTSAITKAEVMAALSAMRRGKHLTEKKFRKAIAGFEVR